MELADAYLVRVESLRDLIEVYDREVVMLERRIHELLRDDRGYQAIQALDGVGRTIAAIFVTEIGDIDRFRSPEALCSWAGLTPRHRESDTKVVRGKITKQGSKLVRWAALEAIDRYHTSIHRGLPSSTEELVCEAPSLNRLGSSPGAEAPLLHRISSVLVERKDGRNACAVATRAPNVDSSADRLDAVDQTDKPRTPRRIRSADAIVANRHVDRFATRRQRDA
jgi:hypothetical protein